MKNFLSKFPKDPIFTSLITVIAGILITVFAGSSFKIVAVILGCIAFVLGLINVVKYFNAPAEGGYNLLTGLLFGVSGLAFIFEPGMLSALVAVVLGILILYHGIVYTENAIRIKKTEYKFWYISLIFGLLTGVAGILLIAMREKFGEHLELITGISLIVEGAINTWTALKLKNISND